MTENVSQVKLICVAMWGLVIQPGVLLGLQPQAIPYIGPRLQPAPVLAGLCCAVMAVH